MRRWLALGLLSLALGCEGPGDWGPVCNAYRTKVRDECSKHGKKGPLWKQVCDPYLDAINQMEQSVPPEGTVQKKYDAAEEQCGINSQKFDELTRDPKDFPR
jgi:hypothetical protein